jgi:tetratricopeptide (TPR) repeat protein
MPNTVNTKKKSSNAGKWIKLGATIIAIVALVIGIKFMLTRAAQTNEYNKIITDLVNQEKYEEAIPRLETLLESAQGNVRDETRKQLANCYIKLGENPSLPLKKSAEYLKKAYDVDPSSLNEGQLQAMKTGLAPPPAE